MADLLNFARKGVYGDLMEYFRSKSRRFRESAEEEKFIYLSTGVEFRSFKMLQKDEENISNFAVDYGF